MPSWISWLWDFSKDNRRVIAFLGGGMAAIASAIWVVFKFFGNSVARGRNPFDNMVLGAGGLPSREQLDQMREQLTRGAGGIC
jgi:hypothetical protein